MEQELVKFNKVYSERHLNLNELVFESFVKGKTSKTKKGKIKIKSK
jgi:hypothetical protein